MHDPIQLLRAICSAGLVAVGAAAAVVQPVLAGTTVIHNAGSGTNRIEVTNNHAQDVQVPCGDERRHEGAAGAAPGASVNSVNIDGRALQGKTVIVSGRNSRDGHAGTDCTRRTTVPDANVNSVNIR